MRRVTATAAGITVTAAMVLGACGGGERLSKAEYIAKGDALCKKSDDAIDPKFDAIFADFPNVDMAKAKAEFPKITAAFDDFRADFEDLEGPEADEKQIDALHADLVKLDGVLDKAGAAAQKGDEEAFKKTLFDAFPLFDETDERARAYGFKVCGAEDDEEEEEDGPRPVLSPEQQAFVQQADAICERTEEESERFLSPIFSGDLDKAPAAIREVQAIERRQIAELRALKPPAGDEAKVKQLLDSREQVINSIDGLVAAADRKDKAAYDAALREVGEGFEKVDDEFGSYGFEECGG